MSIKMTLLSETATPRYTTKKKFVKQWSSFCTTFNANVLSIYAADNIKKIPSIL